VIVKGNCVDEFSRGFIVYWLNRLQFRQEILSLRNVNLKAMCIHFKILIRTENSIRKNASPPLYPMKVLGSLRICAEFIGCDIIACEIIHLIEYVPGLYNPILSEGNLKVKLR
jgi:hypothetical protein